MLNIQSVLVRNTKYKQGATSTATLTFKSVFCGLSRNKNTVSERINTQSTNNPYCFEMMAAIAETDNLKKTLYIVRMFSFFCHLSELTL